jgi:outer membrane protein OmpA-like peptidoglycan-associated protein
MILKKLLKLLPILIISLSISSSLLAQNPEHKWGIELNAGINEYQGDLGSAIGFAKKPNYQAIGLNLGRYLNSSFDGFFNFGVGDLGFYTKFEFIPEPEKYAGFRAHLTYGQFGVRFKFANDKIISASAMIQPYLQASYGIINIYSRINNIPKAYTDPLATVGAGGGGFNFQFSDAFSMRLQTMFNYTSNDVFDGSPYSNGVHKRYKNSDAFMYHSIGVVYHFGEGLGGGTGIKTLKDSDKDGVPNKYDKCKKTREGYLVDSVGCDLDTDGDGIVDTEDKCPKVKGIAVFQGCPDTDGDGIQDSEDACPYKAGTAGGKGCPDTDGDGVYDNEDECVDVPGLKERKGCPRPDTDGDGLFDDEDKCPLVAGTREGMGCPDTDGDGVYDWEDICKTTPGLKTNKGCPEIKKEVAAKIALAAKGIYFETASDVIKEASFTNLDKLATILNEYPEAKVYIEGHTDSDGDDAMNLDLSQRRANSVMAYLSSHGIAAERMTALGFGETKPVAENTSKAGKAKNRRVDFILKY